MRKYVAPAIAFLVGLAVLAGYFLQDQLGPVLTVILFVGFQLVSAAGLIGLGYLLKMHLMKVVHKEKGAFFSVVLIIVFLLVLVMGFALPLKDDFFRNLILNVQIPVEGSLLGILAVVMLVASLRLIRTRGWTPLSIGFLSGALLSFLFDLGFLQAEPGTHAAELLVFLRRLPLIGSRGILLGMALGGLLVGLRVILMVDRPYGDE